MKRRVLSSIMALALCLNLFPVGVFAADAGTGDGLCPHHPAHTDACGYAPPVLEQECTHNHNEGCYTEEINCLHEHTAECYPDSGDASQAGEPVLCAHVCTQDSGCITRTLSCPHEHNDTCGYVAGKPGAPCLFVCAVCPIEDLIGQLPSRLSAGNAERVQAQIEEIYTLYDALTDEEQRQVDLSPCAALLNQMDGMGSTVLVDGSDSNVEKFTLTEDKENDGLYVVNTPLIFITNEHTLTGTNSSAIQVTGTGELHVRGGGAIVSKQGAGVEVQSGGKLYLEDSVSISGTTYALYIASGAEVHLSAGTYSGNTAAIYVEGGDYAALLGEGYAFFDGGSAISPENLASAKTLTVRQCTDHAKGEFKPVAGTPTHAWTCPYCGIGGTEPCTFSFAETGVGSCGQCGNQISVVVDRDSLKVLAYDDTVQPANGAVTVKVGDTVLTPETDYTVSYVTRGELGVTDITVTVTVTVQPDNGTFTQEYIFTQDDLTKPVLEWDTTSVSVPVTVPYTGSPVTKDQLPNVTINITTASGVDLQNLLRYSHKVQGDSAYTTGLPTNAGTYDVVVSIPEGTDYQAASSEPITLEIMPIDPIATPPAAAKPIYNRNPQALVTAGELTPVAVRDGLKIQFATSETGPYSDTIPTGIDAGDSYTVWYQVTGLTDNYIAPDPNPAQVADVKILRKAITPVVTLSQYSYLYDGGFKEPTVTVKDSDRVTDLPDTEYKVEYVNNRNVSTDDNPAKVVVTDKIQNGGNYDITQVDVEFKITSKTQDTLSITNKPSTFTYGDKFTLQTSGGSGNGLVTWEIVPADPNHPDSKAATVGTNSGQVVITGHGEITVKATKSGTDPDTGVVNYEDATAVWTFTADKKPVTATVTAEDKDFDGNTTATVHAEVKNGVLAGDEIKITGLTGSFDNENAGVGKTVTVVTTGAAITGKNSEHYAVTYSATTVTATIRKAVAKITTAPVAATLTYSGQPQELIATAAVVDPNTVQVEYALSETGTYSTDYPKGTNAGTYTVWYRVKETDNYTGLAPASVDVTIAKKPVSPTITLSGDGLQTDSSTPPTYSYIYDGTAKEPIVTLYEADGTTVIPAGEYTVAYSNNINVSTADTPATVTVTVKENGNYSFTPVTKNFTINKEQAKVLTAPKAAGLPLVFSTYAQELVTAGTASGGTMVYRVGSTGDFEEGIPTKTDAGTYNVYYKVQGDSNHSDSDVCAVPVTVTIAPKTAKDPTIELYQDDGTTPLVSYTYDGNPKEPNVVVKDGSDIIAATEYNVVYSDNTDAGHGTVNITDKPGGNYTVTGSATFVINKADIVDPKPQPATLTYNGTAQELLVPGTTTGGTVQYALNSATSTYSDAIPTGVNAGTYNVYYKVTGDKNHNDLPVQGPVEVEIQRKPLTDITIELTPDNFQYDGAVHLPTVTVKDGDTVLSASEYSWACNVSDPKDGGTYTITISDKAGGNYDLTNAAPKTADFIIGKAAQAELVIEGTREHVYYGDTFPLTASGGSVADAALTWISVGENATIDTNGNVTIKGVGEVTIRVTNPGNDNYLPISAQWTFTAAPMPVTASVVVDGKVYDGTTAATVTSVSIATINSDTVTIDPASITAVFDDPHAGTDKTVTLDTSKVQVTGDDAAKYAISYPDTVTATITQATTTIGTDPAAIASLTYNGQPQALVTAGQTNVGFLVYSLSENGEYSREIPTGTDAGTYTVYYKVDGTADYTGVAANTTPISVTIDPKPITPKIELSETSYKYDGTQKAPKVTLKDGDTVIPENQYTVTWAGTKSQTDADMLRVADTYTATITNAANGNYSFTVTASVEITPAEQAALHITGQPEHVYYGDVITTLGTEGGTGDTKDDTVKWSVTAGSATIVESTGVLTITGTGSVTVRAERSVPNYGTVGDNWNFTVEPKPVTAEVKITAKDYDGTTTATVGSVTVPTINGDTVTIEPASITAAFDDANAGTGKTVTLDASKATADNTDKYAVSYPATAKGDINPKTLTSVTVTLSDHDLKSDPNGQYYEYDGTAKEPKVTVKYTEDSTDKVIPDSNYTVEYSNNKNVGDATVTVTAKDGGNYTFTAAPVHFEIRSVAAVLVSSPQAKNLTYEKGTEQELVTVGTATGGTVVYSLADVEADYKAEIPKKEAAGTYTVYYKVKGDANHADTASQQMTAIIKPKEITPTITLSGNGLTETNGVYFYTYDGNPKTPTVTVKDGTEVIDGTEYSVSYRDNVNAGTATVVISDNNGGNYIVNGSVTFEITKAAPTVTAPTEKTGLQYNGELQELVNAGVSNDGTVVYSVNGGNYSAAIPAASAVDTYTIDWKVLGDANHSDTTPATLTVKIDKNTVNTPTITLSSDQFKYNGSQQKPTITVYDDHSRLIPEYEYTVKIEGTNGNVGMVDVDTYTVTVTTPKTSNYVISSNNTRTFQIVAADQETISITGTPAQVRYGDTIQLGVSGGTGGGTVKWEITGNTDTTLTQGGLLTVKDVNTSIKVTVTRSRGGNYTDVSASWEFTAARKPVTADVTVAAKNWDGTTGVDNTAITATVKTADLAFTDDSITISGLTGTYDNANVGTDKTVTLNKDGVNINGTNAGKYDVAIPATATASILAVAATVDTEPAANTLTYDASQSQALVTAGTATGGTMVYSLDGTNFTQNIPKGKDAGKYTVYYKAQGDQNHTDSAVGTVEVTIAQQTIAATDLQIELSPAWAQYDGQEHKPAVTLRDTKNNEIPTTEYTVVYDSATNWKDVGKHKVKVQNITGGNYIITETEKEFEISTSAQAPLQIVNKPGLVYYGDTFTLSATGGSGTGAVKWSSSDTSVATIDENGGLVTIVGVGQATITATKAGDGNHGEATATYPLNAHKKPVTVTVTADDKVYDGNTNATIHFTWTGLVGTDAINTNNLTGTFDNENVGTNKTVTITGDPVSDTTAQKYDITVQRTTTASITKEVAATPNVTAATDLEYTGSAQDLVTGDGTNTLYSASRDGVYSSTVPTGTNAGTYTVWYKAQGDVNHNDSEPQSISVTISPKPLTVDASNVELSGNDLQGNATDGYYYDYDGTEKTPTVTIKDGNAVVSPSEYTVTYSNNKNATTADKKATVTITDKEGGNYVISVTGTVSFEIHSVAAVLTGAPQDRNLTYNGAAQQLVTVGTATGGHIEYQLTSAPTGESAPSGGFSMSIPTGTNAGTYTVDYKVVGEGSYSDGPTGSVTVTIQPKTVISPKITVTGTYTYNSNEQKPTGTAVTVEDGMTTIDASEYTLSYQNNVNAGTATVIVTDNNGGNYTVNGTATFQIGKAVATGTAPTGKTGLKYNGTAQELITAGSSSDGTMVYSLSETGEYSAAIPTGKDVKEYEIWYKVLGDSNHSDSAATALSPKVEIAKNTVTKPTIQVTPPSVKYTGEKQTPTITVKDDEGLLIDGSEYTATYADAANSNNNDLTQVGTYTVTVTGKGTNYSFSKTATFTITQADQTPLTITGTRERVYYGDTIQLSTTGGISGGTVTWAVNSGAPASITGTGLLTITGVGSVTVKATSTKTGYADQTATWNLYADKKPVAALVTAASKTYNNSADATVTATLQGSDFVGTDSFTISLTGCTFEDANAGTDKKVNVVSTSPTFTVNAGGTDNHENYAITYPAMATASIFKADVTDVTAPVAENDTAKLVYTGQPLALVKTAGTATGGTMEYSTDSTNYSASLPTGTDSGNYDVWYRVKGDGNHNNTTPVKLTETNQVTIAPQKVEKDKLTIEFTPDSASYDGAVHKPSVTVKDGNNRMISGSEYTVTYSDTDWKTASSTTVKHIVTIADETGGNYEITTKTAEFTISVMGQNPLSIVGQPGEVRYGDSFTLSTTGGSGMGAVTWTSSDTSVATIGANGLVKTLKSGSTTITATKQADDNYGAVSVTWSFSVEKKPVTAIVTAKDKEHDGTDAATLVITWKDGDVLSADVNTLTTALETALSGKFDTADAGTGKTVTISGTLPDSEKYAITINRTTTASITPKAATLSGTTNPTLTYTGSAQNLVTGITATSGTLVFSTDGSYYTQLVPTGTNAGTYPVWYKAQGGGNYKDSDPVRLNVTIQPKTVNNPVIELSPDSFEYDGTPKKPDVVVKDGSTVIPAVEYTVSYSNNINVGTTAKVTISDNAGGNYTVSGIANFTITAGKATLTTAPQAKVLTYTGAPQELVSRGAADNGTVVYSQTETGGYTTTIPRQTNAGNYEVWYKVQNTDGTDATTPQYLSVTIARKAITAEVLLDPEEFIYSGDPCTPDVFVLDLDSNDLLDPDTDYTVRYMSNTKVGTARVIVVGKGNYSFSVTTTFEIVAAKAKFTTSPTAVTGLTYNGTAQPLVTAGTAEGGTPCYSLDGVSYFPTIPTAIDRGSYTVYAKIQGDSTHEDSDVVRISVTIGVNALTADQLTVTLSSSSFPYTGGEHKPTVTVTDDDGNVISADEYTVTYSGNVSVGTATVSIKSKTTGNYNFTASAQFQIVDANQTPLTITGKKDAVYYGDTLNLGTTGGSGNGAVTWSATGPVDTLGDGQYKVTSSGSGTITATKGGSTDTWTFYAQPKPVTAVVTAANKVYDGDTNATLTVALNGLLPGETVNSVTAQGQFLDADVGTNKTVTIISLTIPDEVGKLYAISHSGPTTASITPAPAAVTAAPTLATGPLTYNGSAQALLTDGGTADGGSLMYSLDGKDYGYTIPTGTDAKTYTVWYKVEAADDNHKDSAAVKLGSVTISANQDTPTVLCTPGTLQYDGTEKTPAVVVRDSAQRIIPESEYTVAFPTPRIAVGTYTVTVTDKPGGNYSFTNPVTGTFEIVAASQNPLSIVTDIPTDVHYGDSFRLSAMGGSGSGAIQWSIEGTAATINDNGVVTVTGTGGFTVKAYRKGADGYSDSNTDSVPFVSNPKPVTPVVTASDKPYDGTTDAALTASWKNGDLVGTDTIALTANGVFATADAGTGKRVNITEHSATGTNVDKYAITWPESTTASIYKVDAKLDTAPADAGLTYNKSAQELVRAGSTVDGIGTIEYSTSQNGTYSTTIPTGTNAGTYTVWYKVADSVNYTGIAPASIQVEIKKADPVITTNPTASGTAGQKLSEITLDGGATNTSGGTFDWESPGIEAEAGKAYNVIFKPNDTANYKTVTFTLTPVSATSGGNTPGIPDTPSTPDSASLQTTIQNGTANTVLSAAGGDKLVKEAVQNQSRNIVIKPEITGDVSKTQVSIPASTVSQINSQTDAALTVASPIADVTIPNGALDTLGSAGGTVNVVTEQVGNAVALTLTAGGEPVDSVPGGVTLTVPAEDAGAGTVAVLIHDDGTREVLQRSVVKDGKLSAPLSGSATVEIVDNGKAFADVQPTDWAAEAVTFASARGLFTGTSESTFSPEETTSRGMVATVLYRLEGQPEQALADVYHDVSDDAWYADSVAWAAENGIVNGYGDGQFGPNDSVTREQFVVMLWRYVGSPEAANHDLTAFTDADQINGYALEALCWAVENGVMNGNGNGRLAPGGTATRAEAAQILKNFIENI